jgi:hypothetical protein
LNGFFYHQRGNFDDLVFGVHNRSCPGENFHGFIVVDEDTGLLENFQGRQMNVLERIIAKDI